MRKDSYLCEIQIKERKERNRVLSILCIIRGRHVCNANSHVYPFYNENYMYKPMFLSSLNTYHIFDSFPF